MSEGRDSESGADVACLDSAADEASVSGVLGRAGSGLTRRQWFNDQVIVPNLPFLALLGVYAAILIVTVGQLPQRQTPSFLLIALAMVTQVLPLLLFALLVYCAYRVRRRGLPGSPIRAVAAELWSLVSDRRRLQMGLPMLGIMVVFKYVYMSFKVNIPLIQPFSWDPYFAELDKVVHGGIDPWRWVDPLFSLHDGLVSALAVNYAMWFFFMWVTFGYFAFATVSDWHRTRFLLAFFLTWIIGGSLLAIVFSSAGPAFYSDLGLTPDPYGPLMEKLTAIHAVTHLPALDLQRLLWEGYASGGRHLGISAMPSMHNAIALLLVLATWNINRAAGIVLLAHATLVYIGSFYLAWHYAIDAYLGWVVAILMWWAAKPVSRWWHSRVD